MIALGVAVSGGGTTMPVHDWTRVDDGIFHALHLGWVCEISRVLNSALLPEDRYSLVEEHRDRFDPKGPRAEAPEPGIADQEGADFYVRRRRTVVLRHTSNHRIIALIEILSRGNKASRHAFRTFLDKALSALAHGIHLLLIDLHPPGPRDPTGVHGAIWQQLTEEESTPPADKPLTLVSYNAGPVKTAYVEPVAVGDRLLDMALFLDPEQYINVPLEATYQAAYAGVPRFYRNLLEV
jgi:hypothetical protein